VSKNVFGYCRVSDKTQNLDRQIDLLLKAGVKKEYIFCDKASGKDFNRRNYLALVGTNEVAPRLQEGNLLVVTSLDRLGRNYAEIKEQWDYITKTLKADIRVLDIPLLDTSTAKDSLDMRFIADLVLQILSYTAQKERENIKTRQAQGIEAAKARGKQFGRPKATYPDNWQEVYIQWKNDAITAVKAMELLGIKRTTFYKLANEFEGK
jgi:Site-specific recombinases, DNA invertase Pin homologs